MAEDTLINEIGEWLIDEALDDPDIIIMFEQLCKRLYGVGIPVGRARLTWPTLHPLFRAETILWKKNSEIEFEQFLHQEETSDAWLSSPMAFMYANDVFEFRRHLDGPNAILDYPILHDLVEQGMTDYLIVTTSFVGEKLTSRIDFQDAGSDTIGPNGVIVNWACDRAGGFSDDDIASLKKIQRRFGVACKTVIQTRIATNVAQTYLGNRAGSQVLDGQIKLGDGRETKAVVWYTDMRNSTTLAETMEPQEFLALLNDYFEATAGPAIEFGGEVLDFIGDAVLAIFPFESDAGKEQAIACASMAMESALERSKEINARREGLGKIAFDFGLGINIGKLMFGNIGVASRLSFSVIGPTVNEVERIEELTKNLEFKALATAEIAKAQPQRWQSIGLHQLKGVAEKCELFAVRADVAAIDVDTAMLETQTNGKSGLPLTNAATVA